MFHNFLIAIILALAMFVSYWGVGRMCIWATNRGILDIPGERSSHMVATPIGGGSIIGVEQSGFIREIGTELYHQMLEEEIIREVEIYNYFLYERNREEQYPEIKDQLEYHKTGYPYDAEKEVWKEIK